MIIDYLLVAIAIVWLAAASISDIKKREVANWLSFSLIAIALGLRAIGAVVYNQACYFLFGAIGLFLFFIIAELFYQTKIFAGGDAKLLVALGAVFATTPCFAKPLIISNYNVPLLAVFFFNVLLCGSIYGILYSIALGAINRKNFWHEFKKLCKKSVAKTAVFEIIMLAVLILFLTTKMSYFLTLYIIAAIYPILWMLVKAVENACMIKLVSGKELTEGDWIVNCIKIGKKTIMPTADGLSKEDIKLIKKAKIKILIKSGIPFVPVFLLAAIASLLNLVGLILSLII